MHLYLWPQHTHTHLKSYTILCARISTIFFSNTMYISTIFVLISSIFSNPKKSLILQIFGMIHLILLVVFRWFVHNIIRFLLITITIYHGFIDFPPKILEIYALHEMVTNLADIEPFCKITVLIAKIVGIFYHGFENVWSCYCCQQRIAQLVMIWSRWLF